MFGFSEGRSLCHSRSCVWAWKNVLRVVCHGLKLGLLNWAFACYVWVDLSLVGFLNLICFPTTNKLTWTSFNPISKPKTIQGRRARPGDPPCAWFVCKSWSYGKTACLRHWQIWLEGKKVRPLLRWPCVLRCRFVIIALISLQSFIHQSVSPCAGALLPSIQQRSQCPKHCSITIMFKFAFERLVLFWCHAWMHVAL